MIYWYILFVSFQKKGLVITVQVRQISSGIVLILFLSHLTELFISCSNAVCESVWMLTRVAQIITAAQRLVVLFAQTY